MQPHDHHFKNVFLDFPREALEWILPDAISCLGTIRKIDFVRQEPKKHNLKDPHLRLDMPILFGFERGNLLLWLVEFQEDKHRFSIFRLLRYATDLMESHPGAVLVPTVLFTDRKKWHKDVQRKLTCQLGNRTYLHFEYQLVRLFDFYARDYYDTPNPIIKILLPKMNYRPDERDKVIRQAYIGLFRLVTPMLFERYVDFIDIYAEVTEAEKETICQEIKEDKETAMIAQHLRNEGFQEGIQKGVRGILSGIELGLDLKFGEKGLKLMSSIQKIQDMDRLIEITRMIRTTDKISDIKKLILSWKSSPPAQ